jgi:hypothetical protein
MSGLCHVDTYAQSVSVQVPFQLTKAQAKGIVEMLSNWPAFDEIGMRPERSQQLSQQQYLRF